MEALADPLFTWGDWPLKVLVWSIVICVVLIVFTWTVARIVRTIKAARDHWRDATPPPVPPPPKEEARVPKPKPGPKRQAARRLFVGNALPTLKANEIWCEKCKEPVAPSGSHVEDDRAFMSYLCANCHHTTEVPITQNG